jgi:uncharacterized protein YbjT (DUF2867 family)
MNVLITGGTGFVGRVVVCQLHEAGHRIRLLARDPGASTARELAARFGAEPWEGDVVRGVGLGKATEGMDAIIHLVGIISEVGQQTFESVHVGATRALLDAARTAGVRRFVHMSALGARPGADARYHRTKHAAEELVRGSGLAWTIFRPSLIYGVGDGFINLFIRMSRFSPILPVIGSGRSRFQPVAVDDVALCFVKALVEPNAENRTFDLCGTEALTLGEIIDAILRVTGRRRGRIRIPAGLARVQASILEVVYPLVMRQAPPLNRDQIIMLEEGNVGDSEAARQLFGWRAQPLAQGLERYFKSACGEG